MSYQVSWFKEGVIINVKYSGAITLSDIQQVNQEVSALIESKKQQKLHVLCDFSETESIPRGLPEILQIARITLKHPRLDLYVIYGIDHHYWLNLYVRILASVFHLNQHIVQDKQAAIAVLQAEELAKHQ